MNGLLAAVILIPSFITTHYLYTECDTSAPPSYETAEVAACAIAIHEPVWFANALFFVNVTVGFWVIGTVCGLILILIFGFPFITTPFYKPRPPAVLLFCSFGVFVHTIKRHNKLSYPQHGQACSSNHSG